MWRLAAGSSSVLSTNMTRHPDGTGVDGGGWPSYPRHVSAEQGVGVDGDGGVDTHAAGFAAQVGASIGEGGPVAQGAVRVGVVDVEQQRVGDVVVDGVVAADQRGDVVAVEGLERQPAEDPRAQHRLAREHLLAAVPADVQQREAGVGVVVQVA